MPTRLLPPFLVAATAIAAAPAVAQQPPAGAMPLSEILAAMEQGGDVAYFDEIEWDSDGYWEIEYRRQDGGRVSIDVDPATGQPRN